MADALAQVKGRLGEEAVILHTRTLRRGGLLGMRQRELVEVTAARSITDLPPVLRRGMLRRGTGDAQDVERTSGHQGRRAAEGAAEPVVAVKDKPFSDASRRVLAELAELKALVHGRARDSAPAPALPAGLVELHTALLQSEVADEIADRLVTRLRCELSPADLRDRVLVRRKLADYVESMLPQVDGIDLSASDGPTVVAFVGSTGVGKTTTVAKLAADFGLRQRRRVGLVTIDTYRIAAAEQLRTYAEIIDLPLHVVQTPADLPVALGVLSGCELILIDTAGRSPADEAGLRELQHFLAEACPHEVHLVLSSTSSRRVQEQAVERFADLGIDRVVFTKLDEAVGLGTVLTCLEQAQARLSYVTTGQDVPHAIESGAARRIAEAIVGRLETGSDSQ